eukprot:2265484-Rhodomonas_salina.1
MAESGVANTLEPVFRSEVARSDGFDPANHGPGVDLPDEPLRRVRGGEGSARKVFWGAGTGHREERVCNRVYEEVQESERDE